MKRTVKTTRKEKGSMRYYFAVIHQEPNGYWAEVPDIRNCATDGDSIEETLIALRDCVQSAIEYRAEKKEKIPAPTPFESLLKKYPGEILMPVEVIPPMKAKRVNITIPGHSLALIDNAVKRAHTNRSEYIVRAALQCAAQLQPR